MNSKQDVVDRGVALAAAMPMNAVTADQTMVAPMANSAR